MTQKIASTPAWRAAGPVLLIFVVSGLVAPAPAHAYLDPISGSVLLQVIVAGVLAFSLGAKRRIARITRFFRRGAPPSDT